MKPENIQAGIYEGLQELNPSNAEFYERTTGETGYYFSLIY